ncbi:type II toxin-antitoxin system HicB family antitoxin [Magnetococcales bacterium HHB-1]
MNEPDYPFTVRPLSDEDGGGYLIEFPDLPGCISDGETIEEAIANGQNAVLSWLETAQEQNRKIPLPSSVNQFSGQWRMRVPKSIHAALAYRAKQEGVSLNMLATTFLTEGLARHST